MLKRFVINRFLACQRKGIEFTSEKVQAYQKSWDKSCENTIKLFDRVMEMKPHETKETLSINSAREFTAALAKPMAEAVELINFNLKTIKTKKRSAKLTTATSKNFELS